MKRCALLLLVAVLAFLIATITYGQRRARRSSQSVTATSEIRRVDFRNFTYPTSSCGKEISMGDTVTVRDGEFKQERGTGEISFYVVKIAYGNLTGDEHEEAIVHVACAGAGWNFELEEIYIYTMQDGHPVLIAEATHEARIRDYRRYYPNGTLWNHIKDIKVQGGRLLIREFADDPHCCPKYVVTLDYSWDGKSLTLNGRPQRMVFKQ